MPNGAERIRSIVTFAVLASVVAATAVGCGGTGPGDEIATPPSTGFTPKTAPVAPTSETSTTTAGPPSTTGDFGTPTLSDASTISTVGLDEVHFGMTLDDAQEAAGTELVTEGPRDDACFLAAPAAGATGVTFLFSEGTVERVDVSAPPIATRSGAKVGSTEAQVKELYGDQIEVQPRLDGQPGNALVFVPRDDADKDFRLVFTTDGTTVVSYRAGRVPQVLAPTGCG